MVKSLLPANAGAVIVMEVLLSYIRIKVVTPLPSLLLSFGETIILTPLFGFSDSTIRVQVSIEFVMGL